MNGRSSSGSIAIAVWALGAAAMACSTRAPVEPPEETNTDESPATVPRDAPGDVAETDQTASGGSSGMDGVGSVPDVAFIAPRGACDVSRRVGRFSIEKQIDFGVVQGVVTEGVVPTAIPRIAAELTACKLLERRNLACSPACVGAETCAESGTCIPYPRQVSVGEVRISGLTRETVMRPQTSGNSYFAPGADNPPYEAQSKIALSAGGTGERGAFQLFGIGSEPLQEAPSWVLEAGVALELQWDAPSSGVDTTVLVELIIDQHGVSPLSLSCEFADTGGATVPASIIDRLVGSGVSGFPNGRITRRTADHVELDSGCVDLVVGSPLPATVAVLGFTPCNRPGDCPNDQTCNLLLQRCE